MEMTKKSHSESRVQQTFFSPPEGLLWFCACCFHFQEPLLGSYNNIYEFVNSVYIKKPPAVAFAIGAALRSCHWVSALRVALACMVFHLVQVYVSVADATLATARDYVLCTAHPMTMTTTDMPARATAEPFFLVHRNF